MNSNTKGWLGLAALAAGAFGIWKYSTLSPEEKARLKAKAQKAGDTLKETYEDVENQVSDKIGQLKRALQKETEGIQ